ncbi:MAG: DUF1761 domain-containing protein [Flavobacteriales bacterium]|nr:MAG: DUF1761 domain-containing protein [Flavobacteriales bacterium]
MQVNWLVQLLAALVPMLVGMIWYNPKVFGTAWMNAAGMTDEKIKGANMPVIYGISLVMAFLFGLAYKILADHGTMFDAFFRPVMEHGMGIDATTAFGTELKGHIDAYVARYSSWTHGLAHSVILSVVVVLPIIVTNALFERKSFKYMMVNWGYWAVTIALMFMVVAQFG